VRRRFRPISTPPGGWYARSRPDRARKFLPALAILLALAPPEPAGADDGGTRSPLLLGVGARSLAMGRTALADADGAITMQARIPYELFRHVRDPWLRVQPGTFFEPQHFHVEFESLPARLLADQP